MKISRKTCGTCGKQCYLTRDEAKRAARIYHPGQVMHAYECAEPSGQSWWHISSIPAGKLHRIRKREFDGKRPSRLDRRVDRNVADQAE